jgi:rare lipoprotein A (peptidoglycan hydrolase)
MSTLRADNFALRVPSGTQQLGTAASTTATTAKTGSTAKILFVASWYGKKFQGRLTSSGERFDLHKLTAAHKTLPLGSLVRLTAPSTGRSVVVRINDRGPWLKGRDFDLSEAAAKKLGIHEEGVAAVEMALFK